MNPENDSSRSKNLLITRLFGKSFSGDRQRRDITSRESNKYDHMITKNEADDGSSNNSIPEKSNQRVNDIENNTLLSPRTESIVGFVKSVKYPTVAKVVNFNDIIAHISGLSKFRFNKILNNNEKQPEKITNLDIDVGVASVVTRGPVIASNHGLRVPRATSSQHRPSWNAVVTEELVMLSDLAPHTTYSIQVRHTRICLWYWLVVYPSTYKTEMYLLLSAIISDFITCQIEDKNSTTCKIKQMLLRRREILRNSSSVT